MIRRVEDPPLPIRPSIPPGPDRNSRLGVAGVAVAVAAGALLGGVTLERIVSRARGTSVNSIEAPAPTGVDRVAESIAASIATAPIGETIAWLASPEREGRDTPSRGLRDAQAYVARRMREIGLRSAPDGGDGFVRRFSAAELDFGSTAVEVPEVDACSLGVAEGGSFVLGRDFVPLAGSSVEDPTFRGSVSAEVVFAGYGIDSESEGYDDFARVSVAGKIALVLAGEPSQGDTFGGADVTAEASIWNKLDALAREGAAGALVVEAPGADGTLSFRTTRARWNPPTSDRVRAGLPTLVITPLVAAAVLGDSLDLEARAPTHDGRTVSVVDWFEFGPDSPPRAVALSAGTRRSDVELVNVVGWLAGAAADSTDDYVVVGAHLDHIGVGPRGRVGRGADDNASGVAAMLAIAAALVAEPPERSVLFVAFTGEEDGLVGSRALAADLPRGREACRAMVNLDMIGRGPTDEVVAFGLDREPSLGAAIEAALATGVTDISRVQAVRNRLFFTRSDHYAFHEVGVPSLFLFEDWPHDSPDYHTWRDTPETVDVEKVRRTAVLAALVTRELARR